MDNNEKKHELSVRCRGIIFHNEKLLTISHTLEKAFYALPGGHLEYGEDIKECIKREIIEELNIEPQIGRLLYIHNCIDGSGKQSIEFFFEITNAQDYLNLNLKELNGTHSYEISDILWVGKMDDVNFKPKQIIEDLKKGNLLSDEVRFIK